MYGVDQDWTAQNCWTKGYITHTHTHTHTKKSFEIPTLDFYCLPEIILQFISHYTDKLLTKRQILGLDKIGHIYGQQINPLLHRYSF